MSLTVKLARSRNAGRGMPGIGDPGLFGSIGSLVGKVAGIAKNIPGPIGWGASAVSKFLPQQQMVGQRPMPFDIRAGFQPQQLPQQPAPGIRAFAERMIPGGETGMQDAPPIGSPAGYHVNKTAYFLKDGTFIPEGSRWVKNRRRNPLNPRAASKAIGRLESLKKATARFSRITIKKKCCHAHTGKKTSKTT